jgi:hypothetical protein
MEITMELGEQYILKTDANVSCVVTKLVEHLVHKYFVHVKTENRTQIYILKEFEELWEKMQADKKCP